MAIFAAFDPAGLPLAFYDDALHAEIPDVAVEISAEQWRDFIDHPLLRRWDGAGVVPRELPPDPPLPPVLTALQARKALRAAGMKAQFEAFVANLPEDQREEWEFATTLPRDHQVLTAAWAGIGRTEAELDDLFALGATL